MDLRLGNSSPSESRLTNTRQMMKSRRLGILASGSPSWSWLANIGQLMKSKRLVLLANGTFGTSRLIDTR